MTRFGIGWAAAAAVAAAACAGSARSSRTTSGATAERVFASAPSGIARVATADAGPAGGPAGGPTRVVVGRVELLDRANDVTLSGTEGVGLGFDKFKIDPSTPVTLNGERASVADISPGDEVRATFAGKDTDAHLQRIEILPARD